MNNKKVVLITGAKGDIGRSLCMKFNQLGYSVAAVDIKPLKTRELPKKLVQSKSFLSLVVDVTNYAQVTKSIQQIKKKLGPIHTVINHAGGSTTSTLSKTTKKDWLADLDLNLNSAYYIISALLPDMRNSGGGNIINIGSVNGLFIYGNPGYSVAKAGLIQLTKFVAVEFGKYGIRSNIVCPGTVKTRFWNKKTKKNQQLFDQLKNLYPMKNIATPDDIANVIIFLASQEARMINGATIVVDGGLTAGIDSVAAMFTKSKF